MNKRLSILHISDLHKPQNSSLDNLFYSLQRDCDEYVNEGILKPEIIVVSGDVVEGSKDNDAERIIRSQYKEVTSFLNKLTDYFLDGDKGRMVIVPGNHDYCYKTSIESMTISPDVMTENDLRDLIDVLSSSVGSLSSAEKITNTFHSEKKSKITRNTVAKFIDYLEDAFLISSASRYDIKGKRHIGAPKKFYFADLGLRNARLNFRQFEETHLMENAIYNELLYRGFNVDVGVVELAQKNESGSVSRKNLEIDFVCNLGSQRYYIQSAFSLPDNEKRAQEIRPFKMVRDSFKKIVVTKDFVPAFYDENGILTMNVIDFLMEPNSFLSLK